MTLTFFELYTDLELQIHDSWITNRFLDPEPKICKTFIFHELFFPKYNFIFVCLSVQS